MSDSATLIDSGAPVRQRTNPFVGPRPYRTGERLYGREFETLELLDVLTADRIVLLYSPSGAGKTSLVQAALVPKLVSRSFRVPSVARVTFEAAKETADPRTNRYAYSLLLSLEEGQPSERQLPVAALAQMSIADYLAARLSAQSEVGRLALILDQFEEILTVDPTDLKEKRDFFTQLGTALDNPRIWALLSMREEHIAGLDPYRSLIPTYLHSRFRLELLNDSQACEAMRSTAKLEGVDFGETAAQKLADDLRRIRVLQPGGLAEERLGPTIEPTVLQVVCVRLWNGLPISKETIDDNDLRALGNADTALADYYAETMKGLGNRERGVREWIGEELITQRGLRNQVLQEDAFQSGRLNVPALELLEDSHLIRAERRRGVTWLELSHDRLVTPIRKNNATWLDATLTPFQRQAVLWERAGRPNNLELRGKELRDAELWASEHSNQLTEAERGLLTSSAIGRRRRRSKILVLLSFPAALVLVAASSVAYLQWFQGQSWAYLTDSMVGHTYEAAPHFLLNHFVALGRNTVDQGLLSNSPLQSQIALHSKVISRLHLFISQATRANGDTFFRADDMRSLNGTTINARFLRYGSFREVQNGDLVALAGRAAFRFEEKKPSYMPFWEPIPPDLNEIAHEAWAFLIDGVSKNLVPLAEEHFFLDVRSDGNIALSSSPTDKTVVEVISSLNNRGFELLNRSREYSLFIMFKYEDRTYLSLQVPPGKLLLDTLGQLGRRLDAKGSVLSGTEYLAKASFCMGVPNSERFEYSDDMPYSLRKAQGIEGLSLIDSDDQPACNVGPFQIVIPEQ